MFDLSFSVEGLAGERGGQVLFEDLAVALEPGQAAVVTGPNGAGKSSLLRILAGMLPPLAGQVRFRREHVAVSARLHYIGHANAVKPTLSVERHIRFWFALAAGSPRPLSADGEHDVVEIALASFDLAHLRDLPPRVLSAGQNRRLALARLLAGPAPLWLLDEPTTALDRHATGLFEAALDAHCKDGGMAVVATHQDLSIPGAKRLHLAGPA